jgi:hypothetical protein
MELVNNAATSHTPQTVATITRHVGGEETWTCKEFTVTVYRCMLSTAKEYGDRPTDRRRKIGRKVHITSPSGHVSDILF